MNRSPTTSRRKTLGSELPQVTQPITLCGNTRRAGDLHHVHPREVHSKGNWQSTEYRSSIEGRDATPSRSHSAEEMSPFPLRCPSCDHGNPVGSNFCNNCGSPVHFETCSHCEAVNHRDARRCHQCGSPLSLSPELLSGPATTSASAAGTESSGGWRAAEPGAQDRDQRTHADDASNDEDGTSISIGVGHIAKADETLAPPRQTAKQDFSVDAVHADLLTARRRIPRLALAVVIVFALAVPVYVAYEDPTRFRQAMDAITPRLDGSSDAHSTPSPQTTSAIAPATGPREPTSPMPDSSVHSPVPNMEATGPAAAQPENAVSELPPPSMAAGEPKPSTSGANSALSPKAAKTVHKSVAKSSAPKSKKGSASHKPASHMPSDARAHAKTVSPAPAPAFSTSVATTVMPSSSDPPQSK
jgi:hypothetical protein